jgi:hypothetical protein
MAVMVRTLFHFQSLELRSDSDFHQVDGPILPTNLLQMFRELLVSLHRLAMKDSPVWAGRRPRILPKSPISTERLLNTVEAPAPRARLRVPGEAHPELTIHNIQIIAHGKMQGHPRPIHGLLGVEQQTTGELPNLRQTAATNGAPQLQLRAGETQVQMAGGTMVEGVVHGAHQLQITPVLSLQPCLLHGTPRMISMG